MQPTKLLRRIADSRVAAVSIGAAVVVTLGGTGAVAAGLVTSAQIKNGSIHGVDVARGAIGSSRLANGSVSGRDLGANSVGKSELANRLVHRIDRAGKTVASPWTVVHRTTIGAGTAHLAMGPFTNTLGAGIRRPPLGMGSLDLETGSGDRAAFGNEVSFNRDLVSGLTSLGFSVFTTKENNSRGHNMPSILIEINPNLRAARGADYAAMVFTPPNGHPGRWSSFDATNNRLGSTWGLSGKAGSAINCSLNGPGCTWDQIQNRLQDRDGSPATIYTVQITKGPGKAFSGAGDKLRVRGNVYDFEPDGVRLVR